VRALGGQFLIVRFGPNGTKIPAQGLIDAVIDLEGCSPLPPREQNIVPSDSTAPRDRAPSRAGSRLRKPLLTWRAAVPCSRGSRTLSHRIQRPPRDRAPSRAGSGLRKPLLTWRAAVPCSRGSRTLSHRIQRRRGTGRPPGLDQDFASRY
jgi:hypothetical protein